MSYNSCDDFDYDAWREESERREIDYLYEDMLNRAYRTGPYEIKEPQPRYERPDDWAIDAAKDDYF